MTKEAKSAPPLSNACANPENQGGARVRTSSSLGLATGGRVRRNGAPPPEELAYTTAATLARRIRRRELSPVEVLDHFIARIEALNPALNALVVFEFDEARERAKAAERKVMSGAELGPLHGVPLAMKDCFDFKPGWRNTFGGVRALKDYVAKSWSMFPERVEQAGAIILGKTNSPTFGFRGTCDNYLFGPTRNPFNLNKNSGGSSGGSAAAVAAGLLPFAEGGDGGGSIRIPAAWCGVYGFKHSFGRVPLRLAPNAFGALNPFIFEGALTRSVRGRSAHSQRHRRLSSGRSIQHRVHRGLCACRPKIDPRHEDRL